MTCFKRRAAAVLNSIYRIKFDFSTAVARRLTASGATPLGFQRRATAVSNSINKL